MSTLHITPLFSGSGGNCTYIEGGGTRILIDAGVSARRIARGCAACGAAADAVDAIFITHEHTDHIAALPVLLKGRDIPVHMTLESYAASGLTVPVITHPTRFEVTVGALTVRSFPVSHDAACCVGYTVSYGDERVGVMTDTGYITDEAVACLTGCESVLIESNHDVDMLRHGRYPRHLQERILSVHGHLSNADCARFCAFLAAHGTREFHLAHLSRENNRPDLALSCAKALLDPLGVQVDCAPEGVV